MEDTALLNAHVQLKKMYTNLNETLNLSRQLAEAVDRDDQVAIHMLLAMRQEPIERLRRARNALEQQRDLLSPEDGQELEELLRGGPPRTDAAAPLAAQVGMNRRVLEQVGALDKAISLKLAREKSIYHQ